MGEVEEGNSLTLIADVPLAIPTDPPAEPASQTIMEPPASPHTKLLGMMAKRFQQMGDLIDSKLQKALDPIKSRLKDLETGPNAWAEEYSFRDNIGNIGIEMGLDNDATPEQQQLLAAQQHAQAWEDEQNKLTWGGRIDDENPYMDTDEAHREQEELEQQYTQPSDLTDDELALICQSEESDLAEITQPKVKYVPGLIRLGARSNPPTLHNPDTKPETDGPNH